MFYFILEGIDDAGSVDVGFMIDAKVSVNGSSQYKVYNSKG
jgi:N-acetylmuramoyl-L-alanine amidase